MTAAEKFLAKLDHLLSREEYSKALEEVEEEGLAILNKLSPSSIHKSLLLLIGRIYYFNHQYNISKSYLPELENLYPDILENINYIIFNLSPKVSKYKSASIMACWLIFWRIIFLSFISFLTISLLGNVAILFKYLSGNGFLNKDNAETYIKKCIKNYLSQSKTIIENKKEYMKSYRDCFEIHEVIINEEI